MEKVYKGFALMGLLLVALMLMAFVREYTPSWKGEQEVEGMPWRQGLYEANCASCHGAEGQGRVSGRAPAIGNPEFLKQASEEFIVQTVKYGRPGSNMMPFGQQDGGILSDTLIKEIAKHLKTLEPEELVEGEHEEKATETGMITGSVLSGKELYSNNCAQCHGLSGQGTVGPELRSPIFQDNASQTFIKNTILRGRMHTPMSAYGKGRNGITELTEQEINDLVLYIRSLRAEGR